MVQRSQLPYLEQVVVGQTYTLIDLAPDKRATYKSSSFPQYSFFEPDVRLPVFSNDHFDQADATSHSPYANFLG